VRPADTTQYFLQNKGRVIYLRRWLMNFIIQVTLHPSLLNSMTSFCSQFSFSQ
jgi:hypothetical protein